MTAPSFELWLEWEIGDPLEGANRSQQTFAHVGVTFARGGSAR